MVFLLPPKSIIKPKKYLTIEEPCIHFETFFFSKIK